ncbi:MAG: CHASE3 domain-containing protein [Ignavibacteriales bacterium]|nr:CHASE3 domain-containing protein [Ignavibacteriales bacterium]
MRFSFLQKIYIGSAIAGLMLVTIGYFSYQSISNLLDAVELRRRSYAAQLSLHKILSQLKDVEVGERGYVMTGEKEFLESYFSGTQSIQAELNNLETLLKNYTQQSVLLTQLTSLVNQKLEFSKHRLQTYEKDGFHNTKDTVQREKERGIMESVRINAFALEKEEIILLQTNSALVTSSTKTTIAIIFLGTLIAIIFLSGAIVLIHRENNARTQAEKALRNINYDLEQRVAERTIELGIINKKLNEEIAEKTEAEAELQKVIVSLQDALSKVKTLTGLLPICAWCKKVRDDTGYWSRVEDYLVHTTDAVVSHGICPDCAKNIRTT